MALEQVPGNLDLKIVQGDDLILQFNVPFSCSGYTFVTTVDDPTATTSFSIVTVCSVQSSISSIVQTTFYASITSLLTPISENTSHAVNITNSNTWKMKYTDNNNLIRTFISGYLEVVEIVT
jgi:hypothetical protein